MERIVHLLARAVCLMPDLPSFRLYSHAMSRFRARVIGLGVRRSIGRNVSIRRGFRFSRHLELAIGRDCAIKEDVSIAGAAFAMGKGSLILARSRIDASGGVTVGSGTQIGRHCEIYSHTHDVSCRETPVLLAPERLAPVTIGADVMLYSNVRVMAGTSIGDGCVVGNSAVVARDLGPYGIYAGIPARQIGVRE